MNEHQQRLEHLGGALLLTFLLVALALVFWTVGRNAVLAAREDNPRRVEEERRIRRGRILDSNGVVLAETVGSEVDPRRVYPISSIGPAVGYYSFRHGTSGVEEGYNATLRGESDNFWGLFWQQQLHQLQMGRDVRLSLNANWQRVADALLGERQGAVVLLTVPDGAIRAMASHPVYDPNLLDEQFEELVEAEDAPLLNRATQSQYQPGLVLQPFLLAAALDRRQIALEGPVVAANQPVVVHGQLRQCATTPPLAVTWSDILQHSCPAPMLTLDNSFTRAGLRQVLAAYGFLEEPNVPLNTAAIAENPVDDLRTALIGQGNLTVTPLQVALAAAALANDGLLPAPQLVTEVETEGGVLREAGIEFEERRALSLEAAIAIREALPVHEGAIREYATLALSGPEGTSNAWYVGLAPASNPHYVVVVIVEEAESRFVAQKVGRALLNFVLSR